MHTLLTIFAIWFVASVVLGVFVGRVIARGNRPLLGLVLLASLLMASCGGVTCSTKSYVWTDYATDGQVIGTRSVPLTVCHERFTW